MKPVEVVPVHNLEVICDGGTSGHPRVFLHIDQDKGEISCPYCSRKFVLKLPTGTRAAAH